MIKRNQKQKLSTHYVIYKKEGEFLMDYLTVRRALHEIPETGFKEFKTQAYLLERIYEMATDDVEVVKWETGIIVKVKGTDAFSIGWRTDIDGLEIQEMTGLPFASKHNGYMHACGHDMHMTIALGALEQVILNRPVHTSIFYFQPAEEGPGGAEPLVNYLKAERPDLLADEIYALHIAPEYPVGTVATRPGLLFANTSELFIDVKGLGGHAAYPHKTKDMSVAAAALLLQLQTIVSRNVDPLDSAVITIGKLNSGTAQNIISDFAQLEGTIRTFSDETMQLVKKRITAMCRGIETMYECEITVDYGCMYHEVDNDAACAAHILDVAANTEGIHPIESPAAMTGEDFGYFLKHMKGAMFWTGANSAYGLHHAQLTPDEDLLPAMIRFVSNLLLTKREA